MKRLTARILLLAMAGCLLLAAGCGRSNVATNFGTAVVEWKENGGAKESDTTIDTYTDGDMAESLGFDVVAYPDTEALTADKFFAIDDWFAQIQYVTPDERSLIVRTSPVGIRQLVHSYTEAHDLDVRVATIDGVEVNTGLAEKGCTLVSWERDGFQFLLHSNHKQDPPSDSEVKAFVTGLACRAAPADESE